MAKNRLGQWWIKFIKGIRLITLYLFKLGFELKNPPNPF